MRFIQLWFGIWNDDDARSGGVDVESPATPEQSPGSELSLAKQRLVELGMTRLGRELQVKWNPRMRSTAGRATWPDAIVELNPLLRDIGEDEVQRTLLHELAHLVAFERAGRRKIRPHGPEWQRACADLGIAGESASHRLELPSRSMRRNWLYVCPHCFVEVARVRRMRGTSACWPCCRAYSGGEYDERFKFIVKRLRM